MSLRRRFLLASSLARLIHKTRGGLRVIEGYFPDREGRTAYVQLEGTTGFLVLRSNGPVGMVDERVEVPRAQAEALLHVTAGEVDYLRTRLAVGAREIHVNRFISPGPLDLISIEFESEQDARTFSPLPWFGPEITADRRYRHQALAFGGIAEPFEIPLSNAALHSLLDTLENRTPAARPQSHSPASGIADPPQPERSVAARPHSIAQADLAADNATEENRLLRELAYRLRPQRSTA